MLWLLFLILLVFVASAAYAGMRGAPWVPTWKKDIERARNLLALKQGETLYELGCGDGRVTTALTKGTGANGVGIELSLGHWMVSNLRKILSGAHHVRFIWADVFHQDLSGADAVYLFLMPETYEKIRPKLEKDLKPGTRIVSYVWSIPGWVPTKVDRAEGRSNVYLYVR